MTDRRPGSSLNPSSEEVTTETVASSRSLASGDQGKFLEVDSSGSVTLTLEATVPQGWTAAVIRVGSGAVAFAAGSGVTIRSTVGAEYEITSTGSPPTTSNNPNHSVDANVPYETPFGTDGSDTTPGNLPSLRFNLRKDGIQLNPNP